MGTDNKWKKIVMFFTFLAFICIFVGGWVFYYYFKYPGMGLASVAMAMQNSMQSLLLSPILSVEMVLSEPEFYETIGNGFKVVIVLYCIAMVIAPFLEVLIVFSILDSFLHLYGGWGHKKERTLIIGYNPSVENILLAKIKKQKIYLWTEESLSSDEERKLFLRKITVETSKYYLGEDTTKYHNELKCFDKFLRKKRINNVIIMNDSDAKNIQYYMSLSECKECEKRTIHFYVQANQEDSKLLLQDYFNNKLKKVKINVGKDNTRMDLRIFDIAQIQAERLLDKLPLYKGVKETMDVHMMIVGGGHLGEALLYQAMSQSVLSGNNNIVIDIVEKDIANLKKRLDYHFNLNYVKKMEDGNTYQISSELADGNLSIRLFEADIKQNGLESVMTNNTIPYTYIALCLPNADDNIHCVYKLQKQYADSQEHIALAIRMPYCRPMKQYLEGIKGFSTLFFMGEKDEYIGLAQVMNQVEEKRIREYHTKYDQIQNKRMYGASSLQEDDDTLWNTLEYYKRLSNRDVYYHQKVKNKLFMDCREELEVFWKDEGREDVEKDDLYWSKKLMEQINGVYRFPKLVAFAKAEHRRFCYYFASEGWGYGKDRSKKLHDCLCNWEELIKQRESTIIYDLISAEFIDEVEA